MSKHLRSIILALVVLSVTIIPSLATVKTVSDFRDISPAHWGIPSITWALNNNMMQGYPDNTFKPDGTMLECEFAALFAKYSSNTDKSAFAPVEGVHWSYPYYKELREWGIPLSGYDSDGLKNQKITRVQIAKIIAAKYGFNLTNEQAVYFMYENRLSKGIQEGQRTYTSYAPDQALTRAQAVAVLMNVSSQGDKMMTFKGSHSIKGHADAQTILGIVGLKLDTSAVDFNDFASMAAEEMVGKIATTVVNGKTVALVTKTVTPSTTSGGYSYTNYFATQAEFDQYMPAQNAVALFKGVELPASSGFKFGASSMAQDDNGPLGGIVGVEYTHTPDNLLDKTSPSKFTDPQAFNALINNLTYLGASTDQVKEVQKVVTQLQTPNSVTGRPMKLIKSTATGNTVLLMYSPGTVTVELYSGTKVITAANGSIPVVTVK